MQNKDVYFIILFLIIGLIYLYFKLKIRRDKSYLLKELIILLDNCFKNFVLQKFNSQNQKEYLTADIDRATALIYDKFLNSIKSDFAVHNKISIDKVDNIIKNNKVDILLFSIESYARNIALEYIDNESNALMDISKGAEFIYRKLLEYRSTDYNIESELEEYKFLKKQREKETDLTIDEFLLENE